MNKDEKIIMFDSVDAAKPYTMDGWLSANGFFYKDEESARYNGCTHQRCDCGNVMRKGWIKCDLCRAKSELESYKKLPFKDWDCTTPLVIYRDDRYFFDKDDILDYCDENDINPADLLLIICEPNYLRPICADYWDDELSEDQDLPDDVQKLIDQINAFNKDHFINWVPGKYRTSIQSSEEPK